MALTASGDNQHTWSSNVTFVLAAVGAAVGLGNIWRFPYVVGENGGSAFVLIYVGCVAFIAIPILVAELLLGRRGSHSPPSAVQAVAVEAGRSPRWSLVGWLGLITGYFIATYYSVIAGWTLAYIFKAGAGFGGAAASEVARQFDTLQAQPVTMTVWHTVFMAITLFIVGRGLHGGIEKTVKILMPALFAMLILMIGYASVAGDFDAGWDFLFSPDFSKIGFAASGFDIAAFSDSVLAAIGQAFFSIGVAMGLMMAYGSYVPKRISLTRSAVVVASADTMVALLAGLMIFPLVFGNGLAPDSGPSLIFRTLPTAFADMPGGAVFGSVFFLLLAFAAVTSLIALIEPIVAYGEDRRGMSRTKSVLIFGGLAWIIGLGSVLSFNAWSDFAPLSFIPLFDGMNIFTIIDFSTDRILMPVGGALIALFVGWGVRVATLKEELPAMGAKMFQVWLWMVRVVAPAGILWILYSNFAPA